MSRLSAGSDDSLGDQNPLVRSVAVQRRCTDSPCPEMLLIARLSPPSNPEDEPGMSVLVVGMVRVHHHNAVGKRHEL